MVLDTPATARPIRRPGAPLPSQPRVPRTGCAGSYPFASSLPGCGRETRQLIAYDFAALHYEPYALQLADVRQGIPRNSDQVGKFAPLDRADLILQPQHFGVDH